MQLFSPQHFSVASSLVCVHCPLLKIGQDTTPSVRVCAHVLLSHGNDFHCSPELLLVLMTLVPFVVLGF